MQWRQGALAREESPQAEASATLPFAAQNQPAAAPEAGAFTAAASRPVVQLPAPARLEGPALDRLAEDVIQRIERRIRIERERRGI
jgi:hypothetical protein